MTPADAAATELARRRREGRRGPRLDPALRPATLADAFVIQARIAARLGTVAGWKCSLPAQDRVTAARLFAANVVRGPHAVVHPRDSTALIEPEVAFVLARDLPRRAAAYGEAEVQAAIGAAHLAIEILGNRYDDPQSVPFPEMLADGANNEGLVVGPAIPADQPGLEGFHVTIAGAAFALERDGRHPDGHPLRPLTWLANFLRERGDALHAGQVITTGSYAGALEVPVATPLTVTFGTLGRIELTLDPAH